MGSEGEEALRLLPELILLLGAGAVRSFTSDDEARASEREDATATAMALAIVVSDALAAGGEVDEALLAPYRAMGIEVTLA